MHRYLFLILLLFGTASAADTAHHKAMAPNCQAFYPQAAVAEAKSGTATLSFQLTADGTAQDIAVAASSGSADLDQAAAACVANTRYLLMGPAAPKPWQDKVWLYGFKSHHCAGLRPAGITAKGITQIAFVISEDGHVQDARIAQSSGYAALDEAALTCSERWRYKPAVTNGHPVAAPWKVRVLWGAQPAGPLAQDKACWRALWPQADALKDVTGPSVVGFLLAGSTIIDLHLTKSSGRPDLDRAALTCMSRINYGELVPESAGETYRDEMTIDWLKPESQPAPNATAM